MKIPTLFRKKKLRATTARRSPLGLPDAADYEEMSEPNMKLSRALLIVLVLHVVAVAGIVAFNTIKTRQASSPRPLPAATNTANRPESANPGTFAASNPIPSAAPIRRDDAKPAGAKVKPIAKEDRKLDQKSKPADKVAAPVDAAKTYVVAKGDNPVTIAKKLKVPYDDLIAANHIDDPHKLQIGQKLIIPPKVAKAKKFSQ